MDIPLIFLLVGGLASHGFVFLIGWAVGAARRAVWKPTPCRHEEVKP